MIRVVGSCASVVFQGLALLALGRVRHRCVPPQLLGCAAADAGGACWGSNVRQPAGTAVETHVSRTPSRGIGWAALASG